MKFGVEFTPPRQISRSSMAAGGYVSPKHSKFGQILGFWGFCSTARETRGADQREI